MIHSKKEQQNDNIRALPVKIHMDTISRVNGRFYLHWHERIELLRVVSGQLEVRCGVQTVRARAGEIIVVNSKEGHSGVSITEKTEYNVVMIELRPFLHDPYCGERFIRPLLSRQRRFSSLIRDGECIRAIDDLIATYNQYGESATMEIESRTLELLAIMLRKHCPENEPSHSIDNRFQQVLDYIDEHYTEPMNISDLAEKYGYDPAYFCRKFKQETGMTCGEYQRALRLEQAASLLQNNQDTPISAIALQCGFGDNNYFSRCFKQHFGMSPTQWQKQK